MRDAGSGLFANEVVRNRWVWYAIGICLALTAAAAWLPGLSTVLEVVPLDLFGWMLVLSGSLAPLLVGQAALSLWRLSAPTRAQGAMRHATALHAPVPASRRAAMAYDIPSRSGARRYSRENLNVSTASGRRG